MRTHPRLSIAILYAHPLLGEGMGRLLAREPGARVTYVPATAPNGLEVAALAHPDVVLVERCAAFEPMRVIARFPDALVIDVAIGPEPAWVYRRQQIPSDPLAIVELVRRLRGGHPAVELSRPSSAAAGPTPVDAGVADPV